ncbi:endochitinase-like [Anopheles bellator]|uniref:endochitinase-like n=1 Tax=Anopheles bellator TaxID=139047 RepID=UPI002648AA4F|nr:endochitinase-like [Anopheles bellator]
MCVKFCSPFREPNVSETAVPVNLHSRQHRPIQSCWLVLLIFCFFLPDEAMANSTSRQLFCMYKSQATGAEDYQIEDIPIDLCTHVIYYGSFIDGRHYKLSPWNAQHAFQEKRYQQLADLKKRRPDVKLLVGVKCTINVCETIANSNDNRETFIESAINLLKKYNLDGVAYHWIWRNQRTKHNYPTLIEETKQAFKRAGRESWTVSVIGQTKADAIEDGLDQERTCQVADFVVISVLRRTSTDTDVPSPKNRRSFDTRFNERYNVVEATKHWINRGCPSEKILLQIYFSGIKFVLANADDHGIDAPINRNSSVLPSFMDYNQICSQVREEGWTIDWDGQSMAPYAYHGTDWIGYENENSLAEKAHFAHSEGLGGLVVDGVEKDDYNGVCGKRYPLLTAVREHYKTNRETQDNFIVFAIERSFV